MKTIIMKTLALGVMLTVIFTGCSKDGATGPTGPQGATGATGAQGQQGNPGTNGTNGNANVNSSTFTIASNQWTVSGSLYTCNLTAPAIINGNTDAVMLYIAAGNPVQWFAMPASNLLVGGDNLEFSYATGTLEIEYSSSTAPSNTWTFKQVVIPGRLRNPNVNHKNYEEVKAAYHLK